MLVQAHVAVAAATSDSPASAAPVGAWPLRLVLELLMLKRLLVMIMVTLLLLILLLMLLLILKRLLILLHVARR